MTLGAGRARWLLLALVSVTVLGGCGTPEPAAPPTTATCAWSAPSPDPTTPTSTCGVAGTDVTVPIPRHADLLPVAVEFYDARRTTCLPAGTCAIGDDRPALVAPTSAPVADPSRRRALLTLDWADDRATLHVNPRCRLVDPSSQQCTAVAPTAVALSLTTDPGAARTWRLHLALDLPPDPSGVPSALADRWTMTLDPTNARLVLDGEGHGNPDVALATGDRVQCTVPGAPPPRPPDPEPVQRYACTVVLPANP